MDVLEASHCQQLLRDRLELFHVELKGFEVVRLKDFTQDSSREAFFSLFSVDSVQFSLLLEIGILHLKVLDLPIQLLGQAGQELPLEV